MNITYKNYSFNLDTTNHSIPTFFCEDQTQMNFALGYLHALKRPLQMEITRLVLEGRLSECLKANDENLSLDIFTRELGLIYYSKKELSKADSDTINLLESYCDGINYGLCKNRPWELKLSSNSSGKWKPIHLISLVKMMSYMGLAASMEDAQRVLLDLLNDSQTDQKQLIKIFPEGLGEIDEKKIRKLKQVSFLKKPYEQMKKYLPSFLSASNVFAHKSDISTILAFDPHLDISHLPSPWMELQGMVGDNWQHGITAPGIPGFAMGGNDHIRYGFTYGFMDQIDFIFTDVHKEKYILNETSIDFNMRYEKIYRKGKTALDFKIYETENGLIERPYGKSLEDGPYLVRRWALLKTGGLQTLKSISEAQKSQSAQEFCRSIRPCALSANWIVIDKNSMNYQQTGLSYKKDKARFFPYFQPPSNDFLSLDDLEFKNVCSPGQIISANNAPSESSSKKVTTLTMGEYRFKRIEELIGQKKEHDVVSLSKIQNDTFSLQAATFIATFSPFFPAGDLKEKIKNWNCHYDNGSILPTLFEKLLDHFNQEIFSKILRKSLLDKVFKEICYWWI